MNPPAEESRFDHRSIWVAMLFLSLPWICAEILNWTPLLLVAQPAGMAVAGMLLLVHFSKGKATKIAVYSGLLLSVVPPLLVLWMRPDSNWVSRLAGFLVCWVCTGIICLSFTSITILLYLYLDRLVRQTPEDVSLPGGFSTRLCKEGSARLKRVRFSIRTLLLLIALFACLFGIVRVFPGASGVLLASIPILGTMLVMQCVLFRGLDPNWAAIEGGGLLSLWMTWQIGFMGCWLWLITQFVPYYALGDDWVLDYAGACLGALMLAVLGSAGSYAFGFLAGGVYAVFGRVILHFLEFEIVLPDGKVVSSGSTKPTVAPVVVNEET